MSNPPIEHHMPSHQDWGPPQGLPPNAGGGPGFGPNPPYMPPPRQLDNYYPPPELPPPVEKQPHQGISAYGREAPMGGHAPSSGQPAPSMITQVIFLLPFWWSVLIFCLFFTFLFTKSFRVPEKTVFEHGD